jgi:hypothetical protein
VCDGKHDTEAGCQTIVEAEVLGRTREEAVANAALVVEVVDAYAMKPTGTHRRMAEECWRLLKAFLPIDTLSPEWVQDIDAAAVNLLEMACDSAAEAARAQEKAKRPLGPGALKHPTGFGT